MTEVIANDTFSSDDWTLWVSKWKCYCFIVINLKVHGLNKFDFGLKLNLATKCDLPCTRTQLKNVYFPSPMDTRGSIISDAQVLKFTYGLKRCYTPT